MTAWHAGYSRLNEKKISTQGKYTPLGKIFSTRGKNSRLGKKDSRLEKKYLDHFCPLWLAINKPIKAVRNDVSREKLRVRSREM